MELLLQVFGIILGSNNLNFRVLEPDASLADAIPRRKILAESGLIKREGCYNF